MQRACSPCRSSSLAAADRLLGDARDPPLRPQHMINVRTSECTAMVDHDREIRRIQAAVGIDRVEPHAHGLGRVRVGRAPQRARERESGRPASRGTWSTQRFRGKEGCTLLWSGSFREDERLVLLRQKHASARIRHTSITITR